MAARPGQIPTVRLILLGYRAPAAATVVSAATMIVKGSAPSRSNHCV
jgi:hypothetical protein